MQENLNRDADENKKRKDHKRRIAESLRNGSPPKERLVAQFAVELSVDLSVAENYHNELLSEVLTEMT